MTTTSSGRTGSAAFVADGLDRLPIGRWHRGVVAVVGLGCFFNFYEVAIGTLMVPLLPAEWTASTLTTAAIIGSTFIGEFFGAFLLTPLADRLGRRRMFQINLLAYVLLAVACAFAPDVGTLILLRLLLGIGLGAELALVDSYLSELLPPTHRGRMMVRCYMYGFLAVPLAGVLGALLPRQLLGLSSWRWLLLFSAVAAAVVWLMRRRLPESPRWLVTQGRADEAYRVLAAIQTRNGVVPEEPPVRSAVVATPKEPRPRLLRPPLRRRTVLACLFEVLGPIGFYGFASIAPLVLLSKGYDVVESLTYSALTALGYPIGALLVSLVADRVQRRTLTIAASMGVAATGWVFGMADAAWLIVAAGLLTAMLNVMQATVSRTYTAEMFPTAVRSTVIGRTYSISRVVAAGLPFVALAVLHTVGAAWLYTGCSVLILGMSISTALLGPRTNRARLEAI